LWWLSSAPEDLLCGSPVTSGFVGNGDLSLEASTLLFVSADGDNDRDRLSLDPDLDLCAEADLEDDLE